MLDVHLISISVLPLQQSAVMAEDVVHVISSQFHEARWGIHDWIISCRRISDAERSFRRVCKRQEILIRDFNKMYHRLDYLKSRFSDKMINRLNVERQFWYFVHAIDWYCRRCHVCLLTLVTSSGSWTSHPVRVSAVTGLWRPPFTSSFNRSFSVRSLDSCFRSVSNSAFFLHLVLRARTLFLSLNIQQKKEKKWRSAPNTDITKHIFHYRRLSCDASSWINFDVGLLTTFCAFLGGPLSTVSDMWLSGFWCFWNVDCVLSCSSISFCRLAFGERLLGLSLTASVLGMPYWGILESCSAFLTKLKSPWAIVDEFSHVNAAFCLL